MHLQLPLLNTHFRRFGPAEANQQRWAGLSVRKKPGGASGAGPDLCLRLADQEGFLRPPEPISSVRTNPGTTGSRPTWTQ